MADQILTLAMVCILIAQQSEQSLPAQALVPDDIDSLPLLVAGWLLVALMVLIGLGFLLSSMRRRKAVQLLQEQEVELLREQILKVREERKVNRGKAEGWTGFANFLVVRKTLHGNSGICSFYLRPLNERLKLAPFFPGQHLVFEVPSKTGGSPLTRRYSLSDAPGKEHYRISVKLAQPPADLPAVPPGKGSSYFHQQLHAQSEDPDRCHLLVAAPQGSFFLNPLDNEPVVLIGGGVGVTPMLSMFAAILEKNPGREVWFFYGVRNSDENILFDPDVLPAAVAEMTDSEKNWHLRICYSQPLERDGPLLKSKPELYSKGRVSIELMKSELPSSNFRYFICGPDAMMNQIEDDLLAWGVPEEHIQSERFGPGLAKPVSDREAVDASVQFLRSEKTIGFAETDTCLLDTAERAGISMASDCRAGSCGECQTAIVDGKVVYPRKTSFRCPPGYCLTCSCLPKGKVVLDC